MPPADNHLLVGIEIDRLVGTAPNVSKHRDLLAPHRKVGNRSRRSNIDPYLTHMNQTGKLSRPASVLRVKIRRVTIRTPIDHFNPFCKILYPLQTANWAKDLFLKDSHFRFSF